MPITVYDINNEIAGPSSSCGSGTEAAAQAAA